VGSNYGYKREAGSDVGHDARSGRAATVDEPIPPAMWPDPGSAFEAHPSSPARQLQGEAMFLQGLWTGGGRVVRAAR